MNQCVKTGIQWAMESSSSTIRRGDLFFVHGAFQVRGVPPYAWPMAGTLMRHAVLSDSPLAKRSDSHFSDTLEGLRIVECSKEFREHILDWYPYLNHMLPPE